MSDAQNEGCHVIRVSIDIYIAIAFDTLNRDILLANLKIYRFRGPAHIWFKVICHHVYKWTNIRVSFLNRAMNYESIGSILILLHINDLDLVSVKDALNMYADDTNICKIGIHYIIYKELVKI